MTDWQEVLDSGGALPDRASRAAAVPELCEALRSPDPVLRDEQAYVLLARWIPRLDADERQTLLRDELSEAEAVQWLDPIAAAFAAGEPGPVPAFASNAMRTLRVIYLLADRGVRLGWSSGDPQMPRHREVLRQRLADTLALAAPFTG